MKCKRCGKENSDGIKKCGNCNFDFEKDAIYQKYFPVEDDPIVEDNEKAGLIDNPILAFIFGILSLLTAILVLQGLIFALLSTSLSILAMYFAEKKKKFKLKVIANVGKWFGYFGLGITVFLIVYQLIGLIL